MVDANHPKPSIRRQCELLKICRSTYYYEPQGEPALNLKLMRMIDEQFQGALDGQRLHRATADGAVSSTPSGMIQQPESTLAQPLNCPKNGAHLYRIFC